MARWMLLLGVVVALAWSGTVNAASPDRRFTAAKRLFDDLEYEKAARRFQKIVKDGTAEDGLRAEAAMYVGIIRLALGMEERSMSSFRAALTFDRNVELPEDASPSIREVFERAQAEIGPAADPPDPDPPVEVDPPDPPEDDVAPPPSKPPAASLMHHQPPAPGTAPAKLRIELDPLRREEIRSVVVHHRVQRESFWFDVTADRIDSHTFEAVIPAPGEAPREYYIDAIDDTGAVAGQVGSAATPFVYAAPKRVLKTPPPEDDAPLYTKWWLYVGGAAVAAGVVAAVVIGTSGGGCAAGDGQGCLEVTLR